MKTETDRNGTNCTCKIVEQQTKKKWSRYYIKEKKQWKWQIGKIKKEKLVTQGKRNKEWEG